MRAVGNVALDATSAGPTKLVDSKVDFMRESKPPESPSPIELLDANPSVSLSNLSRGETSGPGNQDLLSQTPGQVKQRKARLSTEEWREKRIRYATEGYARRRGASQEAASLEKAPWHGGNSGATFKKKRGRPKTTLTTAQVEELRQRQLERDRVGRRERNQRKRNQLQPQEEEGRQATLPGENNL